MDKDELIQQLRAALSWEIAHAATNPAFQASLELQRDKNPKTHIHPFAIGHLEYGHLFKVNNPDWRGPDVSTECLEEKQND